MRTTRFPVRILFSTLALVLLVPLASALAEDEAPALKRGFADGKYVDEYFAVTYEAPELREGFAIGVGGPTVLWAGKCAGDVDVEIMVQEGPKEATAAEVRQMALDAWSKDGKERKEMEQGDGPPPHVLFVQESIAGFQRHHAWGFFARGYQCFIVHAQVREKSETSADALKKALQGLKVGEAPDSLVLAHVVAKQAGRPPNDPIVLAGAGQYYLSEQMKNPTLALKAFRLAQAAAKEGTFDADQTWQVVSGIGLAQLTLGPARGGTPHLEAGHRARREDHQARGVRWRTAGTTWPARTPSSAGSTRPSPRWKRPAPGTPRR